MLNFWWLKDGRGRPYLNRTSDNGLFYYHFRMRNLKLAILV